MVAWATCRRLPSHLGSAECQPQIPDLASAPPEDLGCAWDCRAVAVVAAVPWVKPTDSSSWAIAQIGYHGERERKWVGLPKATGSVAARGYVRLQDSASLAACSGIPSYRPVRVMTDYIKDISIIIDSATD